MGDVSDTEGASGAEPTGPAKGPEGKPGRYNRSANGLIGSMIVVVLVVVGFVVFRGVFSRDLEVDPTDIDYLDTVSQLQAEDIDPVYPVELPAGWIATNVAFDPTDPSAFGVSLLDDEGRFVGVRQDDVEPDEILQTYLTPEQPDAVRQDEIDVSGSVAPTWQGWLDDGGDHGFTAEIDGATVLVFGSAPVSELEGVIASLTTDPVQAR